MAVDQAGRDPAAVAVDALGRVPAARQLGHRAGEGDAAVLRSRPRRPRRRRGPAVRRQRRQPRVEPDRVEPHAASRRARFGYTIAMAFIYVDEWRGVRYRPACADGTRCARSSSITRCCRTAGRAMCASTVDDGAIAAVAAGAQRRRRRARRRHRAARPAESAQPRLPARHGRARRAARPAGRQFLDLARGDVPLPRAARPRTMSRRSRPTPHARCWRRLHRGRRVPLSASRHRRHALCRHRRDGGAHRRGGAADRHRPDAAAGRSMRIGGFGGAAPDRRPAALPQRSRSASARCSSARARSSAACRTRDVGIAPHSLRAVTPEELRAVCRGVADGPIHIHAAEQTKEVEDCVACARRAAGRMAARQCRRRRALVPDPRDPHDRGRDRAAGGIRRGRGPVPAHRGHPRRRHFRRRRTISPPAAASASAPIPTSRSTPPPSCGSSNTRQRLGAARAQRDDAAGGRIDRDGGCSPARSRRRAGARRARSARSQPGARADIVVLDADHPDLAARRGDRVARRLDVRRRTPGSDDRAGRRRMRRGSGPPPAAAADRGEIQGRGRTHLCVDSHNVVPAKSPGPSDQVRGRA